MDMEKWEGRGQILKSAVGIFCNPSHLVAACLFLNDVSTPEPSDPSPGRL